MGVIAIEPDISNAALIIVDMQNDFLHPDGAFGRRARQQPERLAGMSLLTATIPNGEAVIGRLPGRPRPARTQSPTRITVLVSGGEDPRISDAGFGHLASVC